MADEQISDSQQQLTPDPILATERHYQRLFESARDGIIVLNGKDLRISDVNPSLLSLSEYSRAELVGQKISSLGIHTFEMGEDEKLTALLETGHVQFETPLKTRSGLRRDVEVVCSLDEIGGRSCIQCSVRDISERKRSQDKTHFQALLLDTVGQAVIATDLDGKITHWNRSAQRLYGWEHRDVLGRNIADLVVPEAARDHAEEIMALLNEGTSWSDEFNVQRRDGSRFWAWVTNAPIYDDDGRLTGVVGVSHDLSERKQLETAQAQLASIVQTSKDAIISITLGGEILTWNHCAQELYGYTAAEAIGQSFSLIFAPDQRHIAGEVLEKIQRGEAVRNLEMSRGRKPVLEGQSTGSPDGEKKRRFPISDGASSDVSVTISAIHDSRQNVIGASVIARDITAQKLAQEASSRSEKLYRAITQNFPNGVVYLLDLEGRFFLAEGAGMNVVGISADQLLGKTLEDALQGTTLLPCLAKAHENAVHGLETVTEILYLGRHRSIRAVPVRDEAGQISFILAISQDVTDQKQVEETLKRNNTEMRTIWESMSDAFFAVDTKWRFTHMNSQAATLTRQNAVEIIGKNLWEEFPDAINLKFHSELQRSVTEGVPVVFEEYFEPLSMWTEVHCYPSAVGLSVYFRDITDRKVAEQALRASEARFQGIVANVPGMVYQFLLNPDGSFRFPFVSQGSMDLVGLESEEIRDDPQVLLDIIHPEDREHYAETIATSITTMEPWAWEGRGKLQSGEIKWIQAVSRPRQIPSGSTVWDGLLIDITDRKAAEEERDRFFTLSMDMLAIVDRDGYFRRINPAFEATLGYLESEVMARPFLDFVHKDDKASTQSQIAQLLGGDQTLNFLSRCLCADGNSKWLSWHAVSFEDLFYVVAHDITRLIEAEAALRRANEELEQRVQERTSELENANRDLQVENVERRMTTAALRQVAEAYRLAKEDSDDANKAKSEFLSRMSHELRTPLNAILGFGQILQTSELSEDDNEHVTQILYGGWHLLDLINEILDISRVEAGHLELYLEPVSVADVVLESCSLVRPLASQRRVEIDTSDLENQNRYVLADKQRLKQVLINLISNGIKYNRPEGKVALVFGPSVRGRVRVGVRDTGPGLTEADKAKLFTAFERLTAADSEVEGTGLGLLLSRNLVTAMDGSLEVESTVGLGSTFWIELEETNSAPKSDEAELVGTKPPAVSALLESSYMVLSIEDNIPNQQLLVEIMANRPDLVLMTASNGMLGLELAQLHQPDVILLDSNLPDTSGLQILGLLRGSSRTAHIPVIVISADATPLQIERLLGAGALAYLTKPYTVANLLSHLNHALLSVPNEEEKPKAVFTPKVEAALEPKAEEVPPATRSLRILVAEDNVVNQKVVSHQLRKLGHVPFVVDNGLATVEAWQEGNYDLILMDCHMPELDGYEATRKIRRRETGGQHIPILALTANALTGDRDRSLNAGMDDHLNKPVKQAELAAAINRWTAKLKQAPR